MRLSVRPVLLQFLRGLQASAARAVRGSAPRVPHGDDGGPVGGSLAAEVLRADLVQATRIGGAFTPSRLGLRFRLWWHGSEHQRPRGRELPLDVDHLLRACEEELARQVEAEERRRS